MTGRKERWGGEGRRKGETTSSNNNEMNINVDVFFTVINDPRCGSIAVPLRFQCGSGSVPVRCCGMEQTAAAGNQFSSADCERTSIATVAAGRHLRGRRSPICRRHHRRPLPPAATGSPAPISRLNQLTCPSLFSSYFNYPMMGYCRLNNEPRHP